MKMNVLEQKKNPLMNRTEYVISLDHPGKPTPSRQEILKELAREMKAKEDVVIIDKILSKSGVSLSEVVAHVYRKKEDIPQGKLEKMKKRMKKKEEVPVKKEEAEEEERPAEAAPAETPKEESAEEGEKPAGEKEEEKKPEEKAEETEPKKEEQKPAEEKKG